MKRAAILLVLIGGFLGSERRQASAAEDKPQTLFYLDDNRLITLRFQVTVDGKPFGEAWEKFLDDYFKMLDKDEDGKLSAQELGKLTNTRLLSVLRPLEPGQSARFRPVPGGLARKDFAESIEDMGFKPFVVTIESSQNQRGQRFTSLGMPQDPNQAAKLLFARLDRDSDGKLSREEQKNALATLAKSDLDQDETISSAELIPVNFPQYFVVDGAMATSQQDQTRFLSLADQTSIRQVAQKLTFKYDKDPTRDNALSRNELGLSEKLFANHDMDGNGKWDFEEIQQYLRSPSADVTVIVRFGGFVEGRLRIEFQHDENLDSEVKNAIGSLNLGTVQMEISAEPKRWTKLDDVLKSQIRAADADNNGYIDKEESRRLGNMQSLFEVLDADRDEKLFLDEAVEGMLPIARLLSQQIRLTVTDRGRDLFRILDSDSDGRVSKREFWAMPDRAALWDKDKDGRVAESEIPQQYRLVTLEGDVNRFSRFSGIRVVSNPSMGGQRVQRTAAGPEWFRRMDRNNDGDVSTREFLGTSKAFEKLDQNGDGLISAGEASQ